MQTYFLFFLHVSRCDIDGMPYGRKGTYKKPKHEKKAGKKEEKIKNTQKFV